MFERKLSKRQNSQVCRRLADGTTQEEILADFPDLQAEDIQASIAYAARYLDHSVLVTT